MTETTAPSQSMKDMEREERVDLVIRCALQTFNDLTVNCPVSWTTLQLKNHLFELCPTKPDPKRQRLIYAGRCLEDRQVFRDIFEKRHEGLEQTQEQGPKVLHLVCASKEPVQMSSGLRRRAPNNAASNSANDSSPSNGVPAGQGFQQMGGFYMPGPFPQLPANATPEQVAYYSYYMNYHQAAMGWMQYQFAAMNQSSMAFTQFVPMVNANGYTAQINLPAMAHIHTGNAPAAPVPDQNAAPQPAQNANNVAGGGAQANDEEHMNDVLGILYKCIRVGFFLMVLFFYSSLERFLAVFLIICILRYFHNRREQHNRNAAARVEEAPLLVENNGDGNVGEQNPGPAAPVTPPTNDNNNNEVPAPPLEAANDLHSAWNLFTSTVSSFFLSLIPENPLPMDVGE